MTQVRVLCHSYVLVLSSWMISSTSSCNSQKGKNQFRCVFLSIILHEKRIQSFCQWTKGNLSDPKLTTPLPHTCLSSLYIRSQNWRGNEHMMHASVLCGSKPCIRIVCKSHRQNPLLFKLRHENCTQLPFVYFRSALFCLSIGERRNACNSKRLYKLP